MSSDRPLGAMGGCGSIPWSAIDRYADRHGFDEPEAFDRLRRFVRAQDAAFLKDAAAKMEKGGKG